MHPAQISTTLASLAGYSLCDAIAAVSSLGFKSIGLLAVKDARHSIGHLPGFWFDELSQSERRSLRQALQPFQQIAVHAPFMDAPLISYSRHVMETSLRLIRTGMEAAAYLGAPTATIHINSRAFYEVDEYWELLLATLYELGEYGRLLGVKVGVETGYPRDLATFLRIVREVDHPMVGATLDVGHVAFSVANELRGTETGIQQYNDDIEMLCRELGEKIIHLHIHDVRREDWRDHRQVGTGVIDWPRLFANLNQIGYTGLLELEMEEPEREEALLQSKTLMEALLLVGSPVEN